MGLKAEKQWEKDEASRRDSDIGRQLKLEKEKAKKTFKVLLLGTHMGQLFIWGFADWIPGAGESGKSTIIKKMGIVYSNALSEDERFQMPKINESSFELGSTKVQILDVDIQEPKRKKWLNCFEDVEFQPAPTKGTFWAPKEGPVKSHAVWQLILVLSKFELWMEVSFNMYLQFKSNKWVTICYSFVSFK